MTQIKQRLSIELIREALELHPYQEQIELSKSRGEFPRQSGRTTQMLVEAIYFSQDYRCIIEAHNNKYSRELVSVAYDYIDKLKIKYPGFDCKGLIYTPFINRDEYSYKVFIDHYKYEQG